ncbi:MAG TPA: RagB/SusD family nutrient uptake outer membrane protein [Gemmatimonadaceae bacterium]
MAVVTLAGAAAGCDLDLANPNAPTQEEIITSFDGLVAVAVGMQDQYAATQDDYLIPNSLVTDEWGTRQLALASYTTLLTGLEIDAGYATIYGPWANSYETIRSANTILSAQVDLGPVFGPAMSSLAKLYKAMALGRLIMTYEEVPIDISVDAPVPQPRTVVLGTILTLLEEARTEINSVPDAQLSEYRRRVIGNDFDQANVIDAMLARYYLIAEQYADAVTAADRALAGMEEISYFSYSSPDVNPVYAISVASQYVASAKQWAREAEANDDRVPYWADTLVSPVPNTAEEVFALNKYQTQTEPLPAFLPDEMKLIKAEALVRQGAANYPAALALINEVREQDASAFDEPVADLPPVVLTTEAEFLAQIEYERRYELYMQGMRWEDVRRFGAAVAGEAPTIEFLPIPQQECDANPSDPCGA